MSLQLQYGFGAAVTGGLDARFESHQAFVDRHQFNNGCPGVHQELKGILYPTEGVVYLLVNAESNCSCNECRPQCYQRYEIGTQQVGVAKYIEIEVVEIELEVVFAHPREQFLDCRRRGALCTVFPVNQFLPISRLYFLVVEFQSR